jgi:hypothetical protein
MLATTLGIPFDAQKDWDEREQQYMMSGEIVKTRGYVQTAEGDKTGLLSPVGLAFSSRANAFQVVEKQNASANTDLVKLTPFADRAGSARIAAAIKDPINVAFDNRVGRMLILHSSANQLLEVHEDTNGNLDPNTLTRHNIRHFALQDPQGGRKPS